MRRVSTAGAIFALLTILITPALYADDPPPGTEPPQVRIGPPTGVTQMRIGPPTGLAATEETSILDLFWLWLQARIGPPIG